MQPVFLLIPIIIAHQRTLFCNCLFYHLDQKNAYQDSSKSCLIDDLPESFISDYMSSLTSILTEPLQPTYSF